MKTVIRLGEACAAGRFHAVLQYMVLQDEAEALAGWIEPGCDLPEDCTSGLVYDSQSNKLIGKKRPTDPAQVFDLAACCWVMPAGAQWESVRRERDRLMNATDWRVTRAIELGQVLAPEWVAYRQALRDVTKQPDPFAITWPAAPADQSTEAPTEAQH